MEVDSGTLLCPVHAPGETGTVHHGEASVVQRVWGYYKRWRATLECFDKVDLTLPEVSYSTTATWVTVPPVLKAQIDAMGLDVRMGLHGAAHALLRVLPEFISCSIVDVATECVSPLERRYRPLRLLIYDRHVGGLGIARAAHPHFGKMLRAAYESVSSCDCVSSDGCPNCIQIDTCRQYNEMLHKGCAIMILRTLVLGEEAAQEEGRQKCDLNLTQHSPKPELLTQGGSESGFFDR